MFESKVENLKQISEAVSILLRGIVVGGGADREEACELKKLAARIHRTSMKTRSVLDISRANKLAGLMISASDYLFHFAEKLEVDACDGDTRTLANTYNMYGEEAYDAGYAVWDSLAAHRWN